MLLGVWIQFPDSCTQWNKNYSVHNEAWYSADSRTVNQTDHVLICNRSRSAITDIRTLRGPDIGSDHNLLNINFKMKWRVKKLKILEKKNCEYFSKFKVETRICYKINNRLKILENMVHDDNINNNISDQWENIKTII
jgi:predicted secreted Zn-dependent protease